MVSCHPSFSARPGKLAGGQAFVWMDRHLDGARAGPMYLRPTRGRSIGAGVTSQR
jgi:hypothetical protein